MAREKTKNSELNGRSVVENLEKSKRMGNSLEAIPVFSKVWQRWLLLSRGVPEARLLLFQ
jgi:hypothetical protein